ncbi:DUF4352 domain-containing protein [Planotetraspora sp. A-T 1434]|uniref:DUF4352 domain-containing protein n=1 Tax=Planotetraspora sp. A-T 1434 TaxID=2979219 RepID=UPI0021BF9C68|nr:DUF4352 domain-containing protein [Planotetraspora sp. A-T 1434]MCT9932486.1 DUF4352 domain-containing protein [Planotetraspora sp. A-T 1434]
MAYQQGPQDPRQWQTQPGQQPQQPYGPPPGYGYPPARPPKKSNTGLIILAVIGGVLLLLFGGCAVLVAVGASTSSSAGGNADTKAIADRGSIVRDGKFEFSVKEAVRAESIGSGLTEQKPQGEYILVTITVTNIGDEAQHFAGSAQKLIDAAGREYEADTGAAIWLKDSKSLYEQINPGLKVDGTVVFDVPKGLNPVAIELHDSMFSGGVRISLT